MPECRYRAYKGRYLSGFPLKACGNDVPKVSVSTCFQYIYFFLRRLDGRKLGAIVGQTKDRFLYLVVFGPNSFYKVRRHYLARSHQYYRLLHQLKFEIGRTVGCRNPSTS